MTSSSARLPGDAATADHTEFSDLLAQSSAGMHWKQPTAVNPGQWCNIHAEYEQDRPGDYRACGECCHIYRTRQDLLDATAEAEDDEFHGDPGTECPLCGNAFDDED